MKSNIGNIWPPVQRKKSGGGEPQPGAQSWDVMETLLGTAKKLGVNFFHYIRDRVSGAKTMPALADLIAQRAQTQNLSPSWRGT